MPYYITPPPPNPVSRIIAAVIAVMALIGAFMVGMVALLFVAGAGLLVGLTIWARIAWIRYRLRKHGVDLHHHPDSLKKATSGEVIDAEFTVISKHEEQ